MRTHDLKSVVINGNEYKWFYYLEKVLPSGKSRCQVFILDPDGPAVYQTVIRSYLCVLHIDVKHYIEYKMGVTIPF
jgi:hypothetical protein